MLSPLRRFKQRMRRVSIALHLLRQKTLRLNEDSLITAATATSDTVARQGKSTTTALLFSMAIPGAGQIYNGA